MLDTKLEIEPARIKLNMENWRHQANPWKKETERAWIEVNVENLRHNVQALKQAMQPGCELMAVVKAEAYGHGGDFIAAQLNQMGVTSFAVATIEEGIKLRKNGIRGDILILGYTGAQRARELFEYDLTQTLISLEYAKALNEQGFAIKAHLKIDTGMHRLGIASEDIFSAAAVFFMENLHICGMFTHLCCADSRQPDDVAFTKRQIRRFYSLVKALEKNGIRAPKLHIQSSYGLLNYPTLSCDYVRVGIAMYGVLSSPKDETALKLDLRPVLSLKSRIVLIREVKKGECVGYGRSFQAKRKTRIGIASIGYADGVPRNLSNGRGMAWVNGKAAPIIGRVCMDQLALDITDIGHVSVGGVVTLIGAGCGGGSAPSVAASSGSISNELLSRMGARLPVVAT